MATIKDKIGLAMLPSAQSGGASTSTTDFSGTVHSLLPIQYTGPNLVKNGTFDTNSDWVLGSWTIENGVANGNGVASFLTQDGPIEEGKRYLLTYEIKNYVSGSIRWRQNDGFGNFVNGNNNSGNGIYTEIIKPNNESVSFQSLSLIGSIDNIKFQLISNGDFDFERSSSATRVGSDGYIKNVEVLSNELVQNGDFEEIGSELITNGGFDTDSDWDISGSGWSISGGVANFNVSGAFDTIYQANKTTVGKTYKAKFDINITSGSLRFRSGSNTIAAYTSADNGSIVLYYKALGTTVAFQVASNGVGTVDNVSVKEVGENWNFGNGWSINNGYAFTDGTVNQALEQTNVATIGKKYRISLDVTRLSTGYIDGRVWFGSSNPVYNFNDEGSYLFELEANATNLRINALSGNVASWSVDNISVVEVTDDTDIPRLDFSNAAQPSLLLEPERTNEIQYSEGFSQWTNNNTTDELTSSTLSPEGRYNAYKIIEASSGGTHKISSGFVTTGLEYTISVFAKAAERSIVSLGGLGLYTNNEFCQYDLINGTAINTGTTNNASVSIENYGNGWYRCIATYIATGTSGVNISLLDQLYTGNATSGEGQVYQGDNTKGVYIYGAQLEQGSYATSYIPTNGETNGVTRNADVCNNAGDSTIFNDAEGVLFMEARRFDESADYNLICLNDGGTSSSQNFVGLGFNQGTSNFYFQAKLGGTTMINNTTLSTEEGVYYKMAIKYKSGDSAVWIDGKEYFPSSTTFTGSGLKELDLHWFTGIHNFKGDIRQLLYFNEALSDAELERLTSSDITQVLRNYNRRGELLGATYESAHVQTKLNELF